MIDRQIDRQMDGWMDGWSMSLNKLGCPIRNLTMTSDDEFGPIQNPMRNSDSN